MFNKNKFVSTILVAAFAVTALAGCQAAPTVAKPETDRAGNAIKVPSKVEKIVSLNPAITQTLIDMGLKDKIVAIDEYSAEYKDSLSSDVQVYSLDTPDQESIISLKPDIMFTSGMLYVGGVNPYQTVSDAGICIADIPSSTSIAGIKDDIKFVGDCVGASAEAEKIVNDMTSKIEKITQIATNIKDEDKKTVAFLLSVPDDNYPTVYSVGKSTFIDEMITLIGAKNAFGDQDSWLALSEEAVINANPDIILHSVSYVPDADKALAARPGWDAIAAVKDGNIFYIDENASNRPNAHVVEAMEQMAEAIYPDYYAAVDKAA
ncbi:MAG: ABC transporter substrate-binding protein [Clostridiales bacterium]|nr:ABC transporter substrate-binding protein [Clostridiales bacterium]